MAPTLLDTDTLSLFLRREPQVVAHATAYLAEHHRLALSLVSYYEIVGGLMHRDAHRQLEAFLRLADESVVLPLTRQSVTASATLYAEQRRLGTPVDDMDLLIAGIALTNDLVLVTHNQRHFKRIEGLSLADWTAS